MNEIDFEECLKDSPAYRYVLSFSFFSRRAREYIGYIPFNITSFIFIMMPSYRNQLRQATNHIDMLEDRLEQVNIVIKSTVIQ